MPDTRYSSTSSVPRRHRDGEQPRALARLERAVVGVEARAPARPAAWRCRAAPRRHRRRQRAHRRPARRRRSGPACWPGCRCRPRRGRRRRRTRRAAAPRRRCAVAARTGHERRAARREPREIAARHLHAVHGEHARVEKAALVEILHRAARPARVHAGSQAPSSSSSARHGPPPVRDELDFLRRLRQVDAARRQAGSRSIARADRAEHQRRDRVRRVRREAGAHALGRRQRVESARRACVDERGGVRRR